MGHTWPAMSTPDTRHPQYDDTTLQAAMDGACEEIARDPAPVVDGKTPGQVLFQSLNHKANWENTVYKAEYEAAASAVLAAFGGAGLEASQPAVEAWQPAVGEPVRLVSGGHAMTVEMIDATGDVYVIWMDAEAHIKQARMSPACLVSAKEAQP